MSDEGQYIKEVESYFLSLAGEGLMLSSQDYALIAELRDRNVPKEVVLRGISRAFAEQEKEGAEGQRKIRSLRQCRRFIEKSAEDFSPLQEKKMPSDEAKKPTGIIAEAADKLGDFINREKTPTVREYYINLRNKVLGLQSAGEENLLGCIITLESECIEEFFSELPEDERDSILEEARASVERRGRYMTEKAFSESVISFRNEIIHNRYRVKNLYGYDRG